jgi:hypothetical protein
MIDENTKPERPTKEITMNKRATAKLLGAALAVTGLMAVATAAHADIKCRQTVAKESAKATQGIAKTLQKCSQGVLDGKVTGPCPDTKSADSITKAKSKLQAAIVKACATSTGEFAFGRCPNETGLTGSCGSILIKTKDDEGACLACLAEHNAKELFDSVIYGSAIAPANKTIGKCQSTTGKSVLGFYKAKSKALQKCHDGVLKGKIVGACPDQKATDAIAKAESKKVASITKACCGPDKTCGGATCSASTPPVMCMGGTNDGKPCSPSCAGGANVGVACTVDSQCPASTCTGSGDAQCPAGTCVSTAAGQPCEAPTDCGRCRGGTTEGQPCRGSGQCQSDPGACNPDTLLCVGGPNDGHVCALKCLAGANANAICTASSECPGSTCGSTDCPSTGSGTCVGTSGFCGGSDDVSPLAQFGLPSPCPGITLGGSPIVLTGVTGVSLLQCVDTQADDRVQCQDAAGATFAAALPSFCTDRTPECTSSGSTVTVTVAVNSATTLGGVSVSLGYQNALIPGVGDIGGRAVSLDGSALISASDNDDTVGTSVIDFGGLPNGNLFTIQFDTCSGGPAPTTADFGCVVSSASDTNGVSILDGVTCSVASIL